MLWSLSIPRNIRKCGKEGTPKDFEEWVIVRGPPCYTWCSRALYVQKPGSPDEDPSVRMVTNLQKVNQAIKRIGYPMDGAFHNLRRLNPQDTCFIVVDLCQGFHQIPLAEENRDLFKIVLSYAKFCYTCLPQGCLVSSDFVNITPTKTFITKMVIIRMLMTP